MTSAPWGLEERLSTSSRSSTEESTSSSNFRPKCAPEATMLSRSPSRKHFGVRLSLGPAHVPGITRREGEAIGIAQDGMKVRFVGNRHMMEERRHPVRAGQQRLDGTGREAHPRAACVNRHPWPAALGAPPHLVDHSKTHQVRQRGLPLRHGDVEHLFGEPIRGPGQPGPAVEVPAPVRVAAPALGRVAGTVASEERVGVSPDVVCRQLGLEARRRAGARSPGH